MTRGPGATNASIGVHTAFQDSTPMILFIGQVGQRPARPRGVPGNRLPADVRPRHARPGEVGGRGRLAPIALPEYVARAFRTAMQGRPGPVVLALPEDMLTHADFRRRCCRASSRCTPGRRRPRCDRSAALLQAAQRPFVIAGGGGWDAEACTALQRFAENWQLPVGCAFRFQDMFDNRHPLYAGDVGIGINPKLAQRVREADLVLAIGARLGEMTTGGYTLLQAPRPAQKLVHMHAGAEELGRVYAADLLLQASMSCAAQALETLAAPPELPWRGWSAAAHADYEANLRRARRSSRWTWRQSSLTIDAAPRADDTVYTNGAGNFSGWLHRYHRYRGLQHHGRTQLAPTSGAMGYGVPAAVAAACCTRDRIGGQHRRRRRLPDDRPGAGHGAPRYGAKKPRLGRRRQRHLRHDPHAPGARVSRAASAAAICSTPTSLRWHVPTAGDAERSTETAQFEPALRAALEAQRPTLLHLKLDTDVITSRTTLTAIREAATQRGR